VSSELIYVKQQRGFALCSLRSPALSRYYFSSEAALKQLAENYVGLPF
jgi:hypothetical protein